MTDSSSRCGANEAAEPLALGWKGLPSIVLAEANVTQKGGVVRVPYCGLDGREVNAKLVSLKTGRWWWEERGVGVRLFGMERLPDPDSGAGIAEAFRAALANRERRR